MSHRQPPRESPSYWKWLFKEFVLEERTKLKGKIHYEWQRVGKNEDRIWFGAKLIYDKDTKKSDFVPYPIIK